MSYQEPPSVAPLFYTGRSRFLQANENFVQALIDASGHCAIHASEDIFDATGLKLWARGRPIDERLLDRLRNRRLRKPIELCVYAADPVATAAIAQQIESCVAASEELIAALEPHLAHTLKVVDAIIPSPTELLLLSVLRHDTLGRMPHAALVCAVALAAARETDMHPELMRTLARAALFHDIGELYLPPSISHSNAWFDLEQMRLVRTHPQIGAQVSLELARSPASVGQLIAQSHERLDGSGYPAGLLARDLSAPAQALLFAEAMAPLLGEGENGTRRASVAAKMVAGEFCPGMVDWLARCAQARPPRPAPQLAAADIGLDLRDLHTQLAQAIVLLSVAVHETREVQAAIVPWLGCLRSLMRVLLQVGVEDALAFGMNLAPQSEAEKIELSVLAQELHFRLHNLRLQVELAIVQTPEIGSSTLVMDLLDSLQDQIVEPVYRSVPGAPIATPAIADTAAPA